MPPPNVNYKLFVEYEDRGVQRKDIFSEILLQHQTNRFSGHGPLLLAFTNSIHYFEKNTVLQEKLNGPVKDDLYFKMLEKSALKYIRSTGKINIERVKIRLLVETAGSKEQKVYFN